MIVWLKEHDGKCVRLVDRWTPKLYVGGEFSNLLDLACQPYMNGNKFVEKFEQAGDPSPSRVLQVEAKTEKQAVSLASRIHGYGDHSKFRLYNVDVPFTQMYLYENDLFPLAHVEADDTKDLIRWATNDCREAVDYKLPPLSEVRLQVETTKSGKIRRFDDELRSIIITHDNQKTILDFGDETYKLLKLVDAFQELDPDIVTTDDGDSFLFPYLARRAQQNGVLDSLILDRESRPLRIYETQRHSYFSYGKILYRQTVARLFGRLHIDQSNAFFIGDCGLEGLFEVARTCIIPLQRCSHTTIGTSMASLQLYEAVKQGVLIPWNKNEPEEFKDGNELMVADRGGFIFEPQVGIHDDVSEFDFSSLYPTIMLKHNLSGETVKCKCCPESADRVPELGYNICEKWTGIVPRSLHILLRKRVTYKKYKQEAADPLTRLRYDQRQAALKWILVCS
jgi:DNA polymerase elongation subunit (family B)